MRISLHTRRIVNNCRYTYTSKQNTKIITYTPAIQTNRNLCYCIQLEILIALHKSSFLKLYKFGRVGLFETIKKRLEDNLSHGLYHHPVMWNTKRNQHAFPSSLLLFPTPVPPLAFKSQHPLSHLHLYPCFPLSLSPSLSLSLSLPPINALFPCDKPTGH